MKKFVFAYIFLVTGLFQSFAIAPVLSDDSIKIERSKKTDINSDEFSRLKEGDVFPNIVLYDTAQQIVPLDSIFKDSKGVIFVTGSYTCPTFRGSVKQINQMVSNQIHTYRIFVVYMMEAHPLSDSPYGKSQNNTNENARAGISIEQQKWLEERIFYAKKARRDFKIGSGILIDNERNDFFQKIFSGPNGFMIFTPDRKLVRQDIWYNQPKKKPKKERKK
jgi:Iodothyronine deiodinase